MEFIQIEKPWLFTGIKYAYNAMLFTTPWIALSVLLSLAYIFLSRPGRKRGFAKLPPYPEPQFRDELFLVIGELHHRGRPEPSDEPRWLTIPSRGLFTGVGIFGAIGAAKTSGCMLPFAEQILGFQATDPAKRIGGLMLEVKGDFCHKIRSLLEKFDRGGDYVEVSLDGPYRYNPLHNDLDAYTLAFGIASLLNNLYGRSKEPFWQQAYTNLIKFIILLHKVLYDYVTLFDVYECAINPELLEKKIQEGEHLFEDRRILIAVDDFMADHALEKYPFERVGGGMQTPFTTDLEAYLKGKKTAHAVKVEPGGSNLWSAELGGEKLQQFEAVKRWFFQNWKRIDAKLRTSIVESISVFLSLFDDNPTVKRIFCPPKEAYDTEKNASGAFGQALPPFSQMIERGLSARSISRRRAIRDWRGSSEHS